MQATKSTAMLIVRQANTRAYVFILLHQTKPAHKTVRRWSLGQSSDSSHMGLSRPRGPIPKLEDALLGKSLQLQVGGTFFFVL